MEALSSVRELPLLPLISFWAKSLVVMRDADGGEVHLVARLDDRGDVVDLWLWPAGSAVVQDVTDERLGQLEVVSRSGVGLDIVASCAKHYWWAGVEQSDGSLPLLVGSLLIFREYLRRLGRAREFNQLANAAAKATHAVFLQDVIAGPSAVDMLEQACQRVNELRPESPIAARMSEILESWRDMSPEEFGDDDFLAMREVVARIVFLALVHGIRL